LGCNRSGSFGNKSNRSPRDVGGYHFWFGWVVCGQSAEPDKSFRVWKFQD
jgi:hypothetical protein